MTRIPTCAYRPTSPVATSEPEIVIIQPPMAEDFPTKKN